MVKALVPVCIYRVSMVLVYKYMYLLGLGRLCFGPRVGSTDPQTLSLSENKMLGFSPIKGVPWSV